MKGPEGFRLMTMAGSPLEMWEQQDRMSNVLITQEDERRNHILRAIWMPHTEYESMVSIEGACNTDQKSSAGAKHQEGAPNYQQETTQDDERGWKVRKFPVRMEGVTKTKGTGLKRTRTSRFEKFGTKDEDAADSTEETSDVMIHSVIDSLVCSKGVEQEVFQTKKKSQKLINQVIRNEEGVGKLNFKSEVNNDHANSPQREVLDLKLKLSVEKEIVGSNETLDRFHKSK